MNLSPPGRYLRWSIFTVSVANLELIAVMVVIFGLALLLPFPGRHHAEGDPAIPASDWRLIAHVPDSTAYQRRSATAATRSPLRA